MRLSTSFTSLVSGLLLLVPASLAQAIGTGWYVTSYDPGATPTPGGYTDPNTAIGEPERFTGEGIFDSVVSPFSSPFLNTELVSVGEGGHLTLRLTHSVVPDATGPEIGVFTNATIGDSDGDFSNPAATASGSPVFTLGVDEAVVEVSEDGLSWTSLGSQVFDIPTSGYTDLTNPFANAPGSVNSDFHQPFTGVLDDFANLDYYDNLNPDILDLLAGSGGGKWLDISGTGLTDISWIRFSLADDNNSSTSLNFELDAVTITANALGANVPEPTSALLLTVALGVLGCRRRLRRGSTRW